jgi:spore germination protein GerM
VSPTASDEPVPSDVAPATASPTAPATPGPSGSAEPPTESPSGTPSPSPSASPEGTVIVRAYFFLGSATGNEGLVPVLREIPATKAVAAAAMRELVKGPQGAELEGSPAMYSAIPDGTRFLGVTIEDGIATVDLSGEFASGGGSATTLGRLAQVVYTLTQFSTVDRVRFELDGEPVTVFGSEGIVLDHPARRADYRDLLPAIFVDRPAWGAAAGNPVRLTGIANVFEAQFVVQVLDGRGRVLAEQPVMATCGTGCWGTFKTDVAYEIGKAQYGTLRVFEPSARDGKPINVTEYRVWLTP